MLRGKSGVGVSFDSITGNLRFFDEVHDLSPYSLVCKDKAGNYSNEKHLKSWQVTELKDSSKTVKDNKGFDSVIAGRNEYEYQTKDLKKGKIYYFSSGNSKVQKGYYRCHTERESSDNMFKDYCDYIGPHYIVEE